MIPKNKRQQQTDPVASLHEFTSSFHLWMLVLISINLILLDLFGKKKLHIDV